jgi:hypothetical protein
MAACLELLAKLELDPARRELISGFIGAYLRLTMKEEAEFEAELAKLAPQRREQVMEIVTGWMEKGIEKGIERGKDNEARTVCLRLLRKRLGLVDADTQNRIEQLTVERLEEVAEALLDFNSPSDLIAWLDAHCPR